MGWTDEESCIKHFDIGPHWRRYHCDRWWNGTNDSGSPDSGRDWGPHARQKFIVKIRVWTFWSEFFCCETFRGLVYCSKISDLVIAKLLKHSERIRRGWVAQSLEIKNTASILSYTAMNNFELYFLRWIFFLNVCTVQEKGYTFPFLFFQKILSNKCIIKCITNY